MSDPTASPYSSVAGFPDQVINPAPFTVTFNALTGTEQLSWPAVPGALYYDVYFGIEDTRLLLYQSEILTTSYAFPSGALPAGSMFYVQVVAFTSPTTSVGSLVSQVSSTSTLYGVTGNILYGVTGDSLYGAL